jgi:hypothetical protein
MARLEVPVRTSLRFAKGPVLPIMPATHEAESVVIKFDRREFGWLEFKPTPGGDYIPTPTVTTFVENDAEEEWNLAREVLQRFLSALAFEYDTRIEARPTSGGSGTPDLLDPSGARDASDAIGFLLHVAPTRMVVSPDPSLRLALAVYREGLNAGSPFYGFLAFWNVLEATFNGNGTRRNSFLRAEAPSSRWVVPFTGDVAHYLREASRNAIAHIIRRDPGDTSIDPDLPHDRERLDLESRWLRDLARKAISTRWPEPVVSVCNPVGVAPDASR